MNRRRGRGDLRAAWKKAGFKQNPNRNAGLYWMTTPGDKYWRKALRPRDRAERLLWALACVKVLIAARRAGNAGLAGFAGEWGYGCFMFRLDQEKSRGK